ncbi:MAG: hypothetical protein HUK21_10650 [Fibrobacteraceae bacterium]|nr:hypothetical protein [Fibrobacteraceae bacterium]
MTFSFLLGACAGSSAKKESTAEPLSSVDSLVLKSAAREIDPRTNMDLAHQAFIGALEMEMRGESDVAEVLWQKASEADPKSRYLAFAYAERIASHKGLEPLALEQAQKANLLKGTPRASEYALLAELYVNDGKADSARKYFSLAADSSHNQDMPLLYDYALFLEAIKDHKELVRVYALLLPQVNYIHSLLQRQIQLLFTLKKDSAAVALFKEAYEATGDKSLLSKHVQGLVVLKKIKEAKAIADTVTGSSEDDESIVVDMLTYFFDAGKRKEGYEFLKKKYYEDQVRTPLILNFLGHYDFLFEQLDSAKVHLKKAAELLSEQSNYVVEAYRVLTNIALRQNENALAVQYAEKMDSASLGSSKPMLAMTYGFAGEYKKAYTLLDSLLGAWSDWKPSAVAGKESMAALRENAERSFRQIQNSYARILTLEARKIENDGMSDTLRLAYAKENRVKAHLFWEDIVRADSSMLNVRMSIAMNLERLERYDESFKIFESLLSAPENEQIEREDVLNYYGYTLIDLNRSPEEVELGYNMVLQAMAIDEAAGKKTNDAYLDSKAWGLYRKGMYDEALKVMLMADSEMLGEDYVYWEHLAAIYGALGKKQDATKAYKKLLKMRPNHSEALKYLGKKKK